MTPEAAHRFGIVAILGFPNVGKSSLMNALLGQKIAAVAPRPQTTRFAFKGILNRPGWQAVFMDTPGLLEPKNRLEEGMAEASRRSLKDADLVIYVASPDVKASHQAPPAWNLNPKRTLVALNKADLEKTPDGNLWAGPLLEQLGHPPCVKMSVRKKKGLKELEVFLSEHLPEGPAHYPVDEVTDLNLRQMAAEAIREKALLFLRQELPHSMAVAIERYHEREDGLHEIEATLYVERESQKGMVIGKDGAMLKKLGSAARKEIENFADARVFLKLWVKVAEDWKKNDAFLKSLGFPSS